MKNKITILAVLAAASMIVSCEKRLDIVNPNTPTAEVVWQTADYAQKGVNAIYSTYHRVGLSRNQFFINIVRSDEGLSASPYTPLVTNFRSVPGDRLQLLGKKNAIPGLLYRHQPLQPGIGPCAWHRHGRQFKKPVVG